MSYIFKYHPDNTVYFNGNYIANYADFLIMNPDFPLVEGQFFEYGANDSFFTINEEGHHIPANIENYQQIIAAINSDFITVMPVIPEEGGE